MIEKGRKRGRAKRDQRERGYVIEAIKESEIFNMSMRQRRREGGEKEIKREKGRVRVIETIKVREYEHLYKR